MSSSIINEKIKKHQYKLYMNNYVNEPIKSGFIIDEIRKCQLNLSRLFLDKKFCEKYS